MNKQARPTCPRCRDRGWVWYFFWFPTCPQCEGLGRMG